MNNFVKLLIGLEYNPLIISKRFARFRKWIRWPNDFVPFYWERQKTIPGHLKTGDDVRDIGTWDPKALILGAQHVDALRDAPEIVRRQFTLEFARRKDIVEYQKYHIMKKMERHPGDVKSPEVRVTEYTVKIRDNLHHFNKYPDDALRKIKQNKLVGKRYHILTELYYIDYQRYNAIIDKLKISHEMPPLGTVVLKPTRKGELRRLTKEYCDQIKEEKLQKYREKLKLQQNDFIREKEILEKWFEEQNKYLGITVDQNKY